MNKLEKVFNILILSFFCGIFIETILSMHNNNFDYKSLMFIIVISLIVLSFVYKIVNKLVLYNVKKYKKDNIKYIRDDLEKLTPSYVYYIFNLDLDVDKCVNSTLLKFIYDKNISIVNNRFELTDKSLNNLKGSEKFLIKCLNNKRSSLDYKKEYDFENEIFKEAYKQLVINELLKLNYIFYGKISDKLLSIIPITVMLIIFAIAVILTFVLDSDTINKVVGPAALLSFFIIMFLTYIIGFSVGEINDGNNYKRTTKGKELLHKIAGLKKFLKDFSNIESADIETLQLKGFFLIYSIVLNLNDDENKKIQEIKLNSIK